MERGRILTFMWRELLHYTTAGCSNGLEQGKKDDADYN
jgi:hypothetical protein